MLLAHAVSTQRTSYATSEFSLTTNQSIGCLFLSHPSSASNRPIRRRVGAVAIRLLVLATITSRLDYCKISAGGFTRIYTRTTTQHASSSTRSITSSRPHPPTMVESCFLLWFNHYGQRIRNTMQYKLCTLMHMCPQQPVSDVYI